jgi:hypothetical protein
MDNSDARRDFNWNPAVGTAEILNQIAEHASRPPNWLELSWQ